MNAMKKIAVGSTAMTPLRAFNGPAAAQPKPDQSDPAKIVEQIQAAMQQFQSANDERLAAVEKGLDDVVQREQVDKINTEIGDLRESLDNALKEQNRMRAGGGGGVNDNAHQNAVRFFAQASERSPRQVEADGVDVEQYANYRAAFEQLVRRQCNAEGLKPEIRAALSVGSDPDGGYLVPTEVSTEMERRIHDTSPMRQISRVAMISASAWEGPYKSSKGVSGGWVGEKDSRPTTGTGALGMQRIETHEQYAFPLVTQNMLDDGIIDIEQFLVEDTEEEMARTENTAFVSGDGSMKPRGFLDYKAAAVTTDDASRDWGKLQYVASGAAGAFPTVSGSTASDPDALITMISKLNPGYRDGAVWTMNRSTEAAVRKLKDADGRYLVGFGDLRDAVTGFSLLGFPITNLEDMPDIASDSYSIAFGNFRRGYLIVDRIGFRVLRDPYTQKPYVGFYITKRTGGDVRNFDAIKLMKFAA